MSKLEIAVAAASPIKVKQAAPMVSESRSKAKGKNGKRSPRQQFFSALMKRLAGDAGNEVSEAFVNDRHKFKSMMIDIASEMADVE